MKGEVWGGLIPGLPYTAVDYVIIMKNVRHKEEFQIEAKSGKDPKRAVNVATLSLKLCQLRYWSIVILFHKRMRK